MTDAELQVLLHVGRWYTIQPLDQAVQLLREGGW